MPTLILACDLGGTRMKMGLVRAGEVLAQRTVPAQSGEGLAAGLPRIKAAFGEMLEERGASWKECAGVSVAFPSLVDPRTGRVLAEYGKYADAMEIDLKAWAQTEMGLPLAIENDARMALVGEWQHGAGRGCDNLAMITLGTGLGVAAVMEGKLIRGKHGQAAVLGGHSTVRYGGRPCHCGNVGCAEAEASTAFLKEMARSMAGFKDSTLAQEPTLDYAAVFKHAAAGDACAVKLREHSLEVWATLAVNLIHFFDPEVVILGGGIMASRDVILPWVQRHVAQHAHTPWGKVEVRASMLGDKAALVAGEWLMGENG